MRDKTCDIQDKILRHALEDVPFEGWSWYVIQEAAEKAGYDKDMAYAVFPGQLKGALYAFSDWTDRQMMDALREINLEELRVRDRIKQAVLMRFAVLEPFKESVRAASSYWLSPFRKIEAAKLVWKAADKIWIWAGDESKDYNYYTKRALLSGVMTSTLVVWLNDQSEGHRDTLEFLERRIDNVLQFGRWVGKLKPKGRSGKSVKGV